MRIRFLRLIRLWLLVSGVIIFFYSVYAFTTGEVFELKSVIINGDPLIFTDLTVFQIKRNVLFLSIREFSDIVSAKNPWVASIRVTKYLPHTLYIDVDERMPVVKSSGDRQFFIDKEGKVLPEVIREKTEFPSLNCVVTTEVGQTITEETIRQGVQIVFDLEALEDFHPTDLTCIDSKIMEIDFSETRVIYSTAQNPQQVVTSLQLLFKQFRIEGKWPKIVDLRFDKPVLKMTE